jgi:hypothetical protein
MLLARKSNGKRSDAGHFLAEVKAQNKRLSKCPASLGLNGYAERSIVDSTQPDTQTAGVEHSPGRVDGQLPDGSISGIINEMAAGLSGSLPK